MITPEVTELADQVGLVIGGKPAETSLSVYALCVAAELKINFHSTEAQMQVLNAFRDTVRGFLNGYNQ
jgi:hypothetical protein